MEDKGVSWESFTLLFTWPIKFFGHIINLQFRSPLFGQSRSNSFRFPCEDGEHQLSHPGQSMGRDQGWRNRQYSRNQHVANYDDDMVAEGMAGDGVASRYRHDDDDDM